MNDNQEIRLLEWDDFRQRLIDAGWDEDAANAEIQRIKNGDDGTEDDCYLD